MYYAIGVSVPSLHRESTDSLIIYKLHGHLQLLTSLQMYILPEAICCCLQTCYVDFFVAIDGDNIYVYANFHYYHCIGCLVTYTNSSLL